MRKQIQKDAQKFLTLALCVMLMLFNINTLAAWDGYVETNSGSEANGTYLIADMNDYSTVIASGAVPSSKYTKNSKFTARWNHQDEITTLMFKNVPRDVSVYTTLEMWVYSEKATNSQIMFIINCDTERSDGESYRNYQMNIDWEGWKLVSLPLSEFAKQRDGSLAKANHLRIVSSGWSMTPNSETDIYIDSIYLKGGDISNSLTLVFTAEETENANTCVENSLSFYNGNSGAMYGTDKFVPRLGTPAMVISDGTHYILPETLTRLENVSTDEQEIALKEIDGTEYVSAEEFSKVSGLNLIAEKDLLIIGSEKSNEFYADSSNYDIISYEVCYVPVDFNEITDEDFKVIKDRWRKRSTGGDDADLTNEYVKANAEMKNGGLAISNAMNKGADIKNLFQDEPITESAEMTAMYQKIYSMAVTYGTKGTAGYKDKKLLENIKYALDWMYDNIYGDNVVNKTAGWRSPYIFNWWDWMIGSPNYLVSTLIIMENDLEYEDICKYLSPVHTLLEKPDSDFGANTADETQILIGAAALEKDAKAFVKARRYIEPLMRYRDSGNGFHRDGSYIYHNIHPYNGGYGLTHFSNLARLSTLLEGSKLEISNPMKYNIFDMAYNSFESIVYKGGLMSMYTGRQVSRSYNEHQGGIGYINALMYLLEMADEEQSAAIKSMIKYHAVHDMTVDYRKQGNPEIAAIMDDDSIPSDNAHCRTLIMAACDKAVQKRENYAVGISMSSSRIGDYDSINNENTKGWYMSDGMVYFYTDDLRAYDEGFWSTVNPYRLPGITADTQKRDEVSIYNAWLRNRDFVGGVSLEDKYGTAAMDLESYHFDEEDEGRDENYGGGKPVHNSTLVAKKAWFMFDNALTALGSGINSTDNVDVITVVDNRKSNNMEYTPDTNTKTLEIKDFEASAVPEPQNPPSATIDGDKSTKWAADGDVWIKYDLGEITDVGYAAISFAGGNTRKNTFELEVSEDGQKWTRTFSGQSSGTTQDFEGYTLGNQKARFVRFVGHGNTSNAWNSILEFKIFAPSADGKISLGNEIYCGREKVFADGSLLELNADEKSFENTGWVNLENFGGYYFPKTENVSMRKSSNNPSFFELWINHGKNPENGTYEYIMLPYYTPEQTAEYAKNPTVEILSNTDKIQAAKDKNTGVTGIVFWEKGSLGDISASAPCTLMYRENADGTAVLSVSDPTQKLNKLEIAIAKEYYINEVNDKISCGYSGGKIQVTVDTSNSKGKTFEIKLNKKGSNNNEKGDNSGNDSGNGGNDDDGSSGRQ